MSEVYYIIAPVLWTISLGSIAAWVYMYINRGWPPMATKQIELMVRLPPPLPTLHSYFSQPNSF